MNASVRGVEGGAPGTSDGEGSPADVLPPLPFLPSDDGPSPSGDSGEAGSWDGPSSRPGASFASQDRASASGSVLLSQVLGAAESLGYAVDLPKLPVDRIATDAPLRAAILAWIAATGATVPPEELATQLARADALPLPVQRDVALLLLATIEASALQRAALAAIPAEELAWIRAHPEVAEQMVEGLDTPDTRRMALLSSLVDMPRSIEATLLVLQAVEATRGSLSDPAAHDALAGAALDDATRTVLELLARADASASDAQKVRLAAKLVALGGGFELPEPRPEVTFAVALQRLLDATGQAPESEALAAALARAEALPDDLEAALARILDAEALAVRAASPAGLTPTSQHEALAATLLATAEALPVLEKYHLYWRAAPAALRVGEWDPGTRAGWAAHHTALLVSAGGDLVSLVQAAEMVNGRALAAPPQVPARSFLEAYEALAVASGIEVTPELRAEIWRAGDALAPAVRDAAATLMSGAAESARLHAEAFAALTPEERRFLALDAQGLDALYAAPGLTSEQMATLSRATELAERVDARKLAQANAVAASAMTEAHRMLEGADAFRAQASDAEVVPTGLRALLARLVPFGAARAQGESDACETLPDLVMLQCENDVLLRLRTGPGGYTPGEALAQDVVGLEGAGLPTAIPPSGMPAYFWPDGSMTYYTCNDRECVVYGSFRVDDQTYEGRGQANRDLLVITGAEGGTYLPELADRVICAAVTRTNNESTFVEPALPCRQEKTARYGAPVISIDLGGDDTYVEARAMVAINATVPVSFHLDVSGDDVYADPTPLYDAYSPLLSALGTAAGHPTQASAMFGGAAVLLEARGNDVYEAPTRSQGFGRLGVGLLADLDGLDVFDGKESVQGASGDTFTLGAGILLNTNGADQYVARSGQGFGLGGLFLDVGGDDRYANDHDANGVPVVRLDVLPGGNVTAFDRRADDVAWIDGPGSLNAGIGVDQEVVLTAGLGSDRDSFPDLVEFIFGTDPYDSQDSPVTNPTARATALLDDGDNDGYPSYIERALSTDPSDPDSYPAGLPAGVRVAIPPAVMAVIDPLEVHRILGMENGTLDSGDALGEEPPAPMAGDDKIVDLRVPLQNAGSIEAACTGVYYMNASAPPGVLTPGTNIFSVFPAGLTGDSNPENNGPRTTASGKPPERCIYTSYQSTGSGQANGTLPRPSGSSSDPTQGDDFSLRFPAGILAIGDVVDTSYADDYFVVIDIGGRDAFTNAAGGALPVQMRPMPRADEGETDASMRNVNQTFFAPSVVLNVDLASATQGTLATGAGNDRYLAPSRDFAQGAFFGLLLDTAGVDTYVARDGSQGALGGLLLDLAGADAYAARHLSQGAALSHQVPYGGTTRPTRDLPGEGTVDTANVAGSSVALTARRALPGILLDMGEAQGQNTFTVTGGYSQGFARGFYLPTGTNESPPAIGLLASLGPAGASGVGSRDVYVARGRYSQGVGGNDGVGILFDAGGADSYEAAGLVSQGSTISQTVGAEQARPPQAPRPATGILVDLGGEDAYKYTTAGGLTVRTDGRQDNVTLSRAETVQTLQPNLKLYADVGLHVDWRVGTDVDGFLSSVGGTGKESALGEDVESDFVVNLPTARLAIGGRSATTYEREYAFVVDLGGANTYTMNAGGLLRDVLAARDADAGAPEGTASNTYGVPVNAFPVTVLLDAGAGDSRYVSTRSFTQGAGFFGVGVLADLGGRDSFVALPTPVVGHRSRWAASTPIIDGTIGADWAGNDGETITLVAQNDTRFTSAWNMRVANDDRTLYLALTGRTTSTEAADRMRDVLTIHLDMARRHVAWDAENNRTGVDSIQLTFSPEGCRASDRTVNESSPGSRVYTRFSDDRTPESEWALLDATPRFEASCRTTEEGEVVFEIRKDLVVRQPLDQHDLSYCYQDGVGFGRRIVAEPLCIFPANEIGMYLEFMDTGAGFYQGGSGSQPVGAPFSWPASATQVDGRFGARRDNDLGDEMARWGAIGLAFDAHDGDAPVVSLPPSLSHGAAVAGVGVLAMLGAASDATIETGDRALGYGALQGLGIVLDVAGSDLYQGREFVLGASDGLGAGVAVDLAGNDNYRTVNRSLGFTRNALALSGGAIFVDLGGDDEYVWRPQYSALPQPLGSGRVDQAKSVGTISNASFVPLREGNNQAWVQNNGLGLDYRLVSLVSEVVTGTVANVLLGGTSTNLTFVSVVEDAAGKATCSNAPLPTHDGTSRGKSVVNGRACFRATVDLGRALTRGTSALEIVRGFAGEDSAAKAALAELDGILADNSVSAGVNVSSVDFFIDRARVATAYDVRQVSKRTQVLEVMVDLSEVPDGIATVKAMPVFTTKLPTGEVLVFQEGNDETNEIADGLSHKSVYVDNAPRIPAIDVVPAYTGLAVAAYSPFAYGSGSLLNATWNVSPDAGEERLNLFNGWEPHPSNTSVPCVGYPDAKQRPTLCNVLPFYLTKGAELTTQPGTAPAGDPRKVQTEALDSIQPYSAKTAPARTPLHILRNESFHLVIPEREALLPTSPYTTEVRVTIVDPSGVTVKADDNRSIWYAGFKRATAPPQQDVLQGVPIVPRNLRDTVATQIDNLRGLGEGNVVWNTVNTSYDQGITCRSGSTGQSMQCNQTTAHYGTGQIRACKAAPSAAGVGATLYALVATVDRAVAGTGATNALPAPLTGARVCTGAFDHVNNTAAFAGQPISGTFATFFETIGEVGDAAMDTLIPNATTNQSQIDFHEFYFDVNSTPPGAAWQAKGVRFDGDRLVIPPGYRIALEFGLVSDGTGVGGLRPGDRYREAIAVVDGAVASSWPHGAHPITDSIYENNVDFQLNQQQGRAGLGTTIDNLLKGGLIPSSFFTVESGDPLLQPRLEVRVPAEPTTVVDVTLRHPGTEDVAATLLGGLAAVGDRPHPLAPLQTSGDHDPSWSAKDGRDHVNWTVDADDAPGRRWTEYNVSFSDAGMPDGIYDLAIAARDMSGQTKVEKRRVILDQMAPATFVTTDAFAGQAVLGEKNAIPLRWAAVETGAGIKEVHVYARNGTSGDLSEGWAALGAYPPTQTSLRYTTGGGHTTYLFITVGVDRAGNVEGSQNAPNLTAALREAFLAKLARGNSPSGYKEISLDKGDPRLLSYGTVGGKLLNHQGSDFTFLRAGAPVQFQICVRDAESGISGVDLELFPVEPRHQQRARVAPMTPQGPCGAGGTLYAESRWNETNRDPAVAPEGVWRVQMQVFDRAGNTVRVSAGAVVLDHAAPNVTVQAPLLPPGQSAVKPGDTVKIRLLATDAWGVDEAAISVDASAFAQNASALDVRPVRVDGVVYQEATFTVDRPDLQNGIYEIRVHVADLAGNVTVVTKHLAVNFRAFEFVPGSLRVTNVTHNSLELRWRTDEPTTALAKYGTSAVALSGRTTQTVNATTEHVVKVEGLAPSTRYHLRAVSATTGGFAKESDLVEAQTTTALFLRALSPAPGQAVSGNVPVRFAGGLLDTVGFVTYTLEVRDDDAKPWSFVTTATRQGDEHALAWNSSRFLDGTTYQLRLTAEAGNDVASVVIGPITSDNTPASVLVLTPTLATNDTTPALEAEAGDSLSGFGDSPVRLLIDGVPIEANLSVRKDGDRLRIAHEALPALASGMRTFELQVTDAAGNLARETWKVAIDGEAPKVLVHPARFAPGTAAARVGGTVTLNLTLHDLSGVVLAVAETSGLATSPETRLVKLAGTDLWQGTFTVRDASPAARHRVALRVVDAAGNVNATAFVDVAVDNVEPRLDATQMENVGYTRAEVVVPARDEAILVTGTATAPGSPAVTASTIEAQTRARLIFDGLLPSRTYRFTLTATDLAGNLVELAGSFETRKDVDAPGAVGPLSVVDLLDGTLRIGWETAVDNVGVAAYRVYRSDDGGARFQLVAEVAGTTFEDRGLPYEKAYVYRVAALDHGGNEGPSSGLLEAAATAVPKLGLGTATPTMGTASTLFRYTVTYTSPGGRAPAFVRVILDGVPHDMTLESGDALTGAVYVHETRLAPHKRDAPHTYAFEASDGRYAARFPDDGSLLRGPLVSGEPLSDEEVGRLAAFAQRVPLGGAAGVAVAIVAALGIAALVRRKKEGSK